MKSLDRKDLGRARKGHVLVVLAVAYLVYYLAWRITASLNPAAIAFSLMFLVAEIQGALSFVLSAFTGWDVNRPEPTEPEAGLRVDVYVPTLDEDLEVLEATLIGCGALTYPHVTYVLDDGRRPAVAMLAARLGCRYLTRSETTHGRAGNLNAALARTDGDVVAIVDADTVPQPDLLQRTLGYFKDERVALVQLPEEFYNLDSVQHARNSSFERPWHDQSLFYHVVQPGKNRWNAAVWCSGASVVRRAALTAIGGVATGSATPEVPTSIRLHAAGWKTIYHDETLAYSIAPRTFESFSAQRQRSAWGAFQILRGRDNPLVIAGLTGAQRLCYLATAAGYFDGLRRLIYLLTPVVLLTAGVEPLGVGSVDFVIHWLPWFVLSTAASMALGRGFFNYLSVERYGLLKTFAFVGALPGLIGRSWSASLPTDKSPSVVFDDEPQVPLVHLVALTVEVAAFAFGLIACPWGTSPVDLVGTLWPVALGWALTNAALLSAAVGTVVRRPNRRQSYRFPIELDARVVVGSADPVGARVKDISLYGVGMVAASPIETGRPATIVVDLPGRAMTIRGEVVNSQALPGGSYRLGVQFILFDVMERTRLIAFLFIIAPRYQRSLNPRFWTPAAVSTVTHRLGDGLAGRSQGGSEEENSGDRSARRAMKAGG